MIPVRIYPGQNSSLNRVKAVTLIGFHMLDQELRIHHNIIINDQQDIAFRCREPTIQRAGFTLTRFGQRVKRTS